MSFSTAVAVVAMSISVLSLLSVASVRREQQRLGALVTRGIGRTVATSGNEAAGEEFRMFGTNLEAETVIVLRVDGTCLACHAALDHVAALPPPPPGAAFVAVGPDSWTVAPDVAERIVVVADTSVFDALPGAWVPSMVALNSDGLVSDARPVATPSEVDEFIADTLQRS